MCALVERVTKDNISKKPWCRKIGNLVLNGEIFIPRHGMKWDDIVLYQDDKFLFVSSIRNKGSLRHGVICLPLKHISRDDLRNPANAQLLREFDSKILEFIKKYYKSVHEDVRVFENFGSLASVPNHAHKQIWYTKSKGLHFTYQPIKCE